MAQLLFDDGLSRPVGAGRLLLKIICLLIKYVAIHSIWQLAALPLRVAEQLTRVSCSLLPVAGAFVFLCCILCSAPTRTDNRSRPLNSTMYAINWVSRSARQTARKIRHCHWKRISFKYSIIFSAMPGVKICEGHASTAPKWLRTVNQVSWRLHLPPFAPANVSQKSI